jgi:hypothetical protein
MKTIYEWIEICKKAQPEIGQQWEDNVLAQRICVSPVRYSSMSSAITNDKDEGNFTWMRSPQGQLYWDEIKCDMRTNPNKYTSPKRKLFNKV